MRRFGPATRLAHLGCLAAALLLAAPLRWATARAEMPQVGDPAPSFTLTALDGSTFTLAEALKRRSVLVAFVSAPCKPCEDNIPVIATLCGRFYREGRAQVVGIVLNGRDAIVKAFDGQQPICRPLLMEDREVEEHQQTAEAYGVKGTPIFFLVGRDGKIAWRHIGRLDDEKMKKIMEVALAR